MARGVALAPQAAPVGEERLARGAGGLEASQLVAHKRAEAPDRSVQPVVGRQHAAVLQRVEVRPPLARHTDGPPRGARAHGGHGVGGQPPHVRRRPGSVVARHRPHHLPRPVDRPAADRGRGARREPHGGVQAPKIGVARAERVGAGGACVLGEALGHGLEVGHERRDRIGEELVGAHHQVNP